MKKSTLLGILLTMAHSTWAQLIIQSGASLYGTGDVQITLLNTDLTNHGAMVLGSNSRVRFTGNTTSRIDDSQSVQFGELEIAKTTGASLILKSGLTIKNKIVFSIGLIDLNSYNISLGTTGFLENESETSRITGISGGLVTITTNLNAPALANPGNLGALITTSQNLGKVSIQRGHRSQTNANGDGSSIFRYYEIACDNNTGLNATLRLQYFNAELNGLDQNLLTLHKSLDGSHWTNQGFEKRDLITKYVQQINLADFSRWTLSSPNNALPLHWGVFTSRCLDNGVELQWHTLTEYNTRSFFVQRSTDGVQWTNIAQMAAAGNSDTARSYHYFDATAGNFYRILQTDLNGSQSYSIVLYNTCATKEFITVYPNPVVHNAIIRMYSANRQTVLLQVMDSKGAMLQKQQIKIAAGINQYTLNLAGLPAGVYHLLISTAGRQQVLQLQKH